MSQAALAESCETTRESIGKYERDQNVPGGEILRAFGRLGMDLQYVLTGVHSANLYKVAEEMAEYKSGQAATKKREVDPEVLSVVIAGVDEYLREQDLEIESDKKAELIMLLLDLITSETAQDKPAVKSVVAKILKLRTGT